MTQLKSETQQPEEFRFVRVSELMRDLKKLRTYHHWKLDAKYETIEPINHDYWIPLSRCTTSSQILDWIVQVQGKAWGTDEVVGELVAILDSVLDIQKNYCSFGIERGPRTVKIS